MAEVCEQTTDRPRILFIGPRWNGSCARACCHSLRRLGYDVVDVSEEEFIPAVRSLPGRIGRRVLTRFLAREFNDAILDAARAFHPDIALAFKGNYVFGKTLKRLRDLGIATYNYYPDTSAFAHSWGIHPDSFSEYDCIFYTKKFWDADVRKIIPLRKTVYLPHGYDPELHRPYALSSRDYAEYGSDVIFAGTYMKAKEDLLSELAGLRPQLDFKIWGDYWKRNCRSENLLPHVQGRPLYGTPYARALQAAKICIATMSGPVKGSSEGDQTTTRTYEIPACGGFMLHERTPEVLDLFNEGSEIACFDTPQELAEKIDYYLAHAEERKAIAIAGHKRCVPAYSYDERVKLILAWHTEQRAAVAARS
jgi:spore maturation protein CgeB